MKEIVIPDANWREALGAAVKEADQDTVIVVRNPEMMGLALAAGERLGKALTVRLGRKS